MLCRGGVLQGGLPEIEMKERGSHFIQSVGSGRFVELEGGKGEERRVPRIGC